MLHAALLQMGKMISEAENQPRFESGIVLALEDGRWRPFLPRKDSDAYELLCRHQVASFWRDYDEQKRLLDELHGKRGIEIHVAPFTAQEDRATRTLSTVTTWIEGVEALLPRAAQVVFATGDPANPTALGAVPWERVRDAAGHLMEPTDHYPERWRVVAFPTGEQLAAMGLDREAG